MKQVIFVGACAYSGSTLLDLILGNDAGGFSIGEAANFFNPTAGYHVDAPCGCGRPDCSTWTELRAAGANELYRRIFDSNPAIQFVVDSSKDPFWIERQARTAQAQGFAARHVLIWKRPHEIARSYQKRGHVEQWERAWVNYHRLYARLVRDWRAVRYDRLIESADVRQALCAWLDVPYFDGKERYWEKRHCIRGGNHAALLHLHDPGSAAYTRSKSIVESDTRRRVDAGAHRKIVRESVNEDGLDQQVRTRTTRSPYIQPLLDLLAQRDVVAGAGAVPLPPQVAFSSVQVLGRKLARRVRIYRGRAARTNTAPLEIS